MSHDPLTPLQRDLLRELERTQHGGIKRPMGSVPIGRPDDEPSAGVNLRPVLEL
jgi:hypothetical protein